MCPLELALSAVGACISMTTKISSGRMDIDIESVRVETTGKLNLEKSFTLESFAVVVHLKSPATDEQLAALMARVSSISSVYLSLSAGVPATYEWRREA